MLPSLGATALSGAGSSLFRPALGRRWRRTASMTMRAAPIVTIGRWRGAFVATSWWWWRTV